MTDFEVEQLLEKMEENWEAYLEMSKRLRSAEEALKIAEHIGDSWVQYMGGVDNSVDEIEHEVTAEQVSEAARAHFEKFNG